MSVAPVVSARYGHSDAAVMNCPNPCCFDQRASNASPASRARCYERGDIADGPRSVKS